MKKLIYKPTTGNGFGWCERCIHVKKWSYTWMSFMYEIKGYNGHYCRECLHILETSFIARLKAKFYLGKPTRKFK